MIEKIKSWFTEDRAAITQDYTAQVIAASLAAARGSAGVRATGTLSVRVEPHRKFGGQC